MISACYIMLDTEEKIEEVDNNYQKLDDKSKGRKCKFFIICLLILILILKFYSF